MLRKKLRVMLSAEHRENINLPVGYRRVEYLESTGTQYIDSKIQLKAVRKIELIAETVSKKTYTWGAGSIAGGCLLGSNNSGYDIKIWANASADSCRFNWGGLSVKLNDIVYPSGFYHLKITPLYAIADKKVIHYELLQPSDKTNTIGIFKIREPSSVSQYGAAVRLKYLKFNDGELAYFIPCLDGDNKPCLYDVTNKKTFYNTGTGTFLYGAVIT